MAENTSDNGLVISLAGIKERLSTLEKDMYLREKTTTTEKDLGRVREIIDELELAIELLKDASEALREIGVLK